MRAYTREEIRAELASALLSAELAVPTTIESHAAYVGAWVKRLKEDKFEIFRAARDAGRITDFVTGRLVLDAVEPTPEQAAVPTPEPMMKPAMAVVDQPTAKPIAAAFNLAESPALKALMAIKPKRGAKRVKLDGVPAPSGPQPTHAM